MQSILIGKAAAFPNPGRKVVEVEGVSVGVFCRHGKFTAFENVCPHMGGPVCQGKIIARVEELIGEDKTSLGLAFSKDQTNVACPTCAAPGTYPVTVTGSSANPELQASTVFQLTVAQ